jgi:uncharacterized protein (TIGR02118 family)
MASMTVVYRTPTDPEAFHRHYVEVHIPLAKQLPGLRDYQVSTGPITTPLGEQDAFFVSILYFDDLDAIRAAFASPAGQACAHDRQILAPGPEDALMMLFDTTSA